MAITPETNIKLLKVPLLISNKNQLTFSSESAQYNYFNRLPKIEIDECSYQRKDNVIRYPAHIDSIIEYNYCMYQNSNYGDKWFYAYITNMEYENDGLTNITIKTDVWQTWQFDINFKRSFVEREHVNNDTIGANTIDENLNIGEVIEEYKQEDIGLSQYPWLAIASSYNPATEKQFDGITVYNNQVFGYEIHLISTNPTSNLQNFLLYLLKANADGHIEDIKDVFLVPNAIALVGDLTQNTGNMEGQSFSFYTLPFSNDVSEFNQNIRKQHTFSDYTPKNNKCFCYPYNYLFVSNNIGNQNIYKYEDFSDNNNATFKVQLALAVGGSGRLLPTDYKGKEEDDDESLTLAKFPTCGWSADSYINWLTQNAVNLPTQIVGNLLGGGQNIIQSSENPKTISTASDSANIVGTVGNIVTNIAGTMGQFYSASLMPNIEASQNTGDVNYSAKRNTFTFRCMRAKTEYLKTIDDFFSMFGYKVNLVKVPNLTGRQNWNYVKTIDCNITGNIPQMDLSEIKNMFDVGVTLWHNTSTFLDYSQNNSIT